ncbi:hypothetical protein VNI00_010388 [Paramarasmius palmivorus]|uniref:FAD-binding domain-containing protein n=1 Tax=Paramarasmius palmivorus TaxID=297713 RepID=A0AAW0CMA0_9AGAR
MTALDDDARLHFIVIGAGHAGLACALGLRRSGHRVTVLEASTRSSELEAEGYRLPPNLLKILEEWDLGKAVRTHSTKCDSIHVSRLDSGEYLGGYRWDDELLRDTGGETVFIQDTDLHKILLEATISHDVDLRTNVQVIDINPEVPSITVTAKSTTTTLHADVIIGTDASLLDGISSCEMSQFSLATTQEETGIEIIGTVVPRHLAASDLGLHRLCASNSADMFIWVGDECSVLTYPKGNRQPDIMMQTYIFSEQSPSSVSRVSEKRLTKFEPRLQRLSTYSKSTIKSRRVILRHILDEWVQGKMLIIGDWAHPLPPGSLQSLALSIEDAQLLISLFSYITHRSQIATFLHAFQNIRKPRCEEIHTKEYGIIYYMSLPPGEQREYRDQALRARRDAGLFTIGGDPTQDWRHRDTVEEKEVRDVFGYDAREEAERWWLEWGMFDDIEDEEDSLSNKEKYAIRVRVEKSITQSASNFWFLH